MHYYPPVDSRAETWAFSPTDWRRWGPYIFKKKRKKKPLWLVEAMWRWVQVPWDLCNASACVLCKKRCARPVFWWDTWSQNMACAHTLRFYFDIGLWGGVGLNQWGNLTDVHTKMELRALHHTFSPRNSTFVWACLSKKNIIDGMLQDVRIWNKSVAFLRSEEHPALKSFLMVSFPTLPVSICLVIIGPK